MPSVTRPANQPGEFLVDYEEKVFPDVKAEPGEKALLTFHTVAFEGSIGLVNLLQASRLINKGFETSILLYGPGVTLGLQRGFPKLGDAAFDGHLNFNARLEKFMGQGGKVLCLSICVTSFVRAWGRSSYSRDQTYKSFRCSRYRVNASQRRSIYFGYLDSVRHKL